MSANSSAIKFRHLAGVLPVLIYSSIGIASVQGKNTSYTSPNGISEHCVAITPIPGGRYHEKDHQQEQALCEIDFYDSNVALCPKTFSTSPGTLVYLLKGGSYAGRAAAFESDHCTTHHVSKTDADSDPISYKMTMNARDTSATFSTSSLLYYHFSRYFNTDVSVPVSVYRSMDRKVHGQRVAARGVSVSAGSSARAMNHAGWKLLHAADQNPSSYQPVDELFTSDRSQVYGVMLHQKGKRYNEAINGTRESGWGAGQNRDFQQTAPFLALRHNGTLEQAIDHGVQQAAKNHTLRKAMGSNPSYAQMVFWMKELSEIALLDYIFSQQDRIGNVDYRDYWYWKEDGAIKRKHAREDKPPAEIGTHNPVRLRRSMINDNDAGGKIPYANFSKQTGMLENLQHFGPQTYTQLIHLNRDFEEQGDLYSHLRDAFGLSSAQVAQVVKNTAMAANILQQACLKEQLRFDLAPVNYLATGEATQFEVSCHES